MGKCFVSGYFRERDRKRVISYLGITYYVGHCRVDTFWGAEVHALDGLFGLGDEDGLAAGGVHIRVFDVFEVEGSEGGAVQEGGGGGEIIEQSFDGWVVSPHCFDTLFDNLLLKPDNHISRMKHREWQGLKPIQINLRIDPKGALKIQPKHRTLR